MIAAAASQISAAGSRMVRDGAPMTSAYSRAEVSSRRSAVATPTTATPSRAIGHRMARHSEGLVSTGPNCPPFLAGRERSVHDGPHSIAMLGPIRGVTSRRALLASGWDAMALQRELRSGRIVTVRRGAYAPALLLAAAAREPNLAHAVDIAAVAATQHRQVVASHLTAAMLHRLDVLAPPSRLEFTSPTGVDKLGRGYRIRVATLPASHIDRHRGVFVTTVARTVIDIGRTAPLREALVVADAALRGARVDKEGLREAHASCRRWPGSDAADVVVHLADGRAESPLETLGRLLVLEHGLPAPELQLPIWDDEGIFAYVDLGWPAHRVAVEFDGMVKYDGRDPGVLRREKLRQERLERLGWIVVRLTWHDVVYEPDRAMARLRAALARAERR